MASGHVNRANRPNTWLHRPSLQREDSPCQPGAVHTWHFATHSNVLNLRPLWRRTGNEWICGLGYQTGSRARRAIAVNSGELPETGSRKSVIRGVAGGQRLLTTIPARFDL
jgi:hypothetical protein